MKRKHVLELAVVLLLTAGCAFYLGGFDAFERITDWTRAHEGLELDEILLSLPLLVLGLSVFALRRTREARKAEKLTAEAWDAARQATEIKDQLLRNLGHELRTPVNGMMGYLQLLKTGQLDEKQDYYVNVALASGKSMLAMLNTLLSLSQLRAGKLDQSWTTFFPGDILETVVSSLAPLATMKSLDLKAENHPDMPNTLRGNNNVLKLVLFNLVGNAIKFTDSGRVTINGFLLNKDEDKPAVSLRYEVADTGAGIPSDKIDEIFQPFNKPEQEVNKDSSGLGLSIARRLVEHAGGELGVESTPGKGSTFHVILPVRLAE